MAVSGNNRTSTAITLLVTSAWLLGVTSSSPDADRNRGSEVLHPKASRGPFSPRMDYDEWTPLGRGDPLKNDPTYDYVPPVLDRVHYWIDPSSRTADPPAVSSVPLSQSAIDPFPQSEVPALRPNKTPEVTEASAVAADSRRDTYEPFLQFVDAPKFNSAHQQHYYHHHRPLAMPHQSSKPYSSVPASYYPSSHYQHHPGNVETQPSYTPNLPPGAQQRPPYTMLVPPPLQAEDSYSMELQEPDQITTEPPTTTPQNVLYYSTTPPAVIVEEANLIFQSSTLPDWEEGKTQFATLAEPSNYVTLRVPTLPTETATLGASDSATNSTPLETETVKTLSVVTTSSRPFPPPTVQTKYSVNLPSLQVLLQNEVKQEHNLATTVKTTTTRPTTVTMTAVTPLTTDPFFSHYKQPAEPLRGPMYLIIQGHSKVKTYGVNKRQNSFYGIPIQNSNEIQHQANYEYQSRRIGREMDLEGVEENRWFYKGNKNRDGNTGDLVDGGRSVHDLNVVKKNVEDSRELFTDEESLMTNGNHLIHSEEDDTGHGHNFPTMSEESEMSSEQVVNRTKRQLSLEDFIPFDDDTAEELVHDYLVKQGQGSGIGAIIASTLTRIGRLHNDLDQPWDPDESNALDGSRAIDDHV